MFSHNYIEKHVLVSDRDITSLIKAEWQAVRSNQVRLEDLDAPISLFPNSCCGILFLGHYALASNGHWLMRAVTDGPSLDYNVSHFFYDYIEDDVFENVNPFHEEGIGVREMLAVTGIQPRFSLKIRPQDIKDFIEQLVPAIRERRICSFKAKPLAGTTVIEVTIESKKGEVLADVIRLPEIITSAFTSWSVNCSYIHKIASILTTFTDVVVLEFNGYEQDPIIFRIPSTDGKYDVLTFVLGQYFITKEAKT